MCFHQVGIFSILVLLISGRNYVTAASITVVNKCQKTVWPAIQGNIGLGSTGFELPRGSSRSFHAPIGWSGHLWGRTECNFKHTNNGSCTTGDCGSGQLQCNGYGATRPATIAEFAFQFVSQWGTLDYYDVTLVHGFNLPMLVETSLGRSQSGLCASTGCTLDLNKICPKELRAEGGVACKSPCDVFGTPEYCCTGNYASRSKCVPTNYSRFFKSACPTSYSYAFDDQTSAFSCIAANYTLTFCPSSSSILSLNLSNSNVSTDPSSSLAPSNLPDIRGDQMFIKSGNKLMSLPFIILIIAFIVVVVILLVVTFAYLRRSKKWLSYRDEEDISLGECLNYSLKQVQNATNNFSEDCKIGQGGFGPVYKGILPNGQEVAVKRLSKSSMQGLEEFKNEIMLLAKLQHKNLVRLLGFCFENQEMILIYEYFRNKSLENFLFVPEKRRLLDWTTRHMIIGGIARGLLYLHEDSQLRIIHRDLKASNVLLDENMNPKIADFGTARLLQLDQTNDNTARIAGTYGYMAPEYAIYGQISVKSDVFSFGVLLLEIISGQKNNSFYESNGVDDLGSYAWKNFMNGIPLALLDPSIRELYARIEVIHFIHIALLCVQEDPHFRPTMASVVIMLSSNTVTLPIPQQPAFFTISHVEPEKSDFLLRREESFTALNPR